MTAEEKAIVEELAQLKVMQEAQLREDAQDYDKKMREQARRVLDHNKSREREVQRAMRRQLEQEKEEKSLEPGPSSTSTEYERERLRRIAIPPLTPEQQQQKKDRIEKAKGEIHEENQKKHEKAKLESLVLSRMEAALQTSHAINFGQ